MLKAEMRTARGKAEIGKAESRNGNEQPTSNIEPRTLNLKNAPLRAFLERS
jgi:hypothetical protein